MQIVSILPSIVQPPKMLASTSRLLFNLYLNSSGLTPRKGCKKIFASGPVQGGILKHAQLNWNDCWEARFVTAHWSAGGGYYAAHH